MKKNINKEKLHELVIELVGPEAIEIVDYLNGKKRISEFIVAEELEQEIHRTRFLLYKLLEHNLVSFIRKKDKIKGWYICYWDLNEPILNHLHQKQQEAHIEKMQARLKREESNKFYMCSNACTRQDFDTSIENNFKCPECGQLMNELENNRTIEFLTKRIDELKALKQKENPIVLKEAS